MMSKQKEYKIQSIKNKDLIISGNGDDYLWNQAEVLTNFSSPWDKKKPLKIIFKALSNQENFFFNFTVFDTDIHIEKQDDSIESIGNSDRVELFFRPDSSLNPYYCMEIDVSARIMDFKAYPNKNFDFNWNWPKNDITVKSSINMNSFIVEGSISIQSLKNLNLIKNNKMETGIFRAKYSLEKNGHFEPVWITWVDPKTETPNFHTASSFGTLLFCKDDD